MKHVKKSSKKNYGSALVHILAWPIEALTAKAKHAKHAHRTAFTLFLGLTLLLIGAFISSIHQDTVPHFIWEAGAYGIHGLGLAPIAKIIFDIIEIEI